MFDVKQMNEAMDSVRNLEDFDSFMAMESVVCNEDIHHEAAQILKESEDLTEYRAKPTDWSQIYAK